VYAVSTTAVLYYLGSWFLFYLMCVCHFLLFISRRPQWFTPKTPFCQSHNPRFPEQAYLLQVCFSGGRIAVFAGGDPTNICIYSVLVPSGVHLTFEWKKGQKCHASFNSTIQTFSSPIRSLMSSPTPFSPISGTNLTTINSINPNMR